MDEEQRRRQEWAEGLAERLDRPMGVLGVVFLFVVLGQSLAEQEPLITVLAATGWALWLVFVGEFVLRLVAAPRRRDFLRRNWWQVVFLVVPFLRFLRVLRVLRLARAGGVLSSAVRGSRSAGRLLSSRAGWLLAVSAVVVLASSQLLVVGGNYQVYADALYDVALATIAGEPLPDAGGVARVLSVILAAYSVVVFAALAATLGAYFLRADTESGTQSGQESGTQSDTESGRGR